MKNKTNFKNTRLSEKACQWVCIVKSSLLVGTFFSILAIIFLIWVEEEWLRLSQYVVGAIIIFTPVAIITFFIEAIMYPGESNPWVRLVQSSLRIGLATTLLWMLVIGISKNQQLAYADVLSTYLSNTAGIFGFVTAIAFGIKILLRTIGNKDWKIQESSNLIYHLMSKYHNYNYLNLSVDEAQKLSEFILSLSKDHYQELGRMKDETFKLAINRLLGEIVLEFPEIEST